MPILPDRVATWADAHQMTFQQAFIEFVVTDQRAQYSSTMEPMSPVYRLTPEAREALAVRLAAMLAERPDVLFALAFGSFVDHDAFRDVDVGIWTAETARPGLDMELSAALSRGARVPVDVRRLNEAPVPFLFHALRGRVLAVRDERLLAELMERTARDYHDRAPILRRATREAFAR